MRNGIAALPAPASLCTIITPESVPRLLLDALAGVATIATAIARGMVKAMRPVPNEIAPVMFI
jgi:hypothetical protein